MSLIYLGWEFICVVCITLLCVQPILILSAFFFCHPYIPLSNSKTLSLTGHCHHGQKLLEYNSNIYQMACQHCSLNTSSLKRQWKSRVTTRSKPVSTVVSTINSILMKTTTLDKVSVTPYNIPRITIILPH